MGSSFGSAFQNPLNHMLYTYFERFFFMFYFFVWTLKLCISAAYITMPQQMNFNTVNTSIHSTLNFSLSARDNAWQLAFFSSREPHIQVQKLQHIWRGLCLLYPYHTHTRFVLQVHQIKILLTIQKHNNFLGTLEKQQPVALTITAVFSCVGVQHLADMCCSDCCALCPLHVFTNWFPLSWMHCKISLPINVLDAILLVLLTVQQFVSLGLQEE